jgi:hypothetical protein
MKKLLLVCACLLALNAYPMQAQAGEPEVVIVQIWVNGIATPRMVITRGEGMSETSEFKAGVNEKGMVASGETYQKAFSKLYQEGYTLQSTFSHNFGGGIGNVVTLTFAKVK